MLLVHSENLLLVDNTIKYPDLFLVAYLSGISSRWLVTQVQNDPVEWDEQSVM